MVGEKGARMSATQTNDSNTLNALDCISRREAIDALWKALYEYEDKTEKQFLESEELDIATWFLHRIFVQNMSDIDRQTILNLPSAQPEPRWIPVEIKPPKEKKTYWVCTDTGYQCECRWTNNRFGMIASDEWGWSIFDTPQYTKVVAWRELPKPYREETEDAVH